MSDKTLERMERNRAVRRNALNCRASIDEIRARVGDAEKAKNTDALKQLAEKLQEVLR